MQNLAKDKPLFIGLSCLSVGCLISAFAQPLQKLEVWKQAETGQFGIGYEKTFIITESDRNYPYGFSQNRAIKIAQIYQDYKLQKILLLAIAGLCGGYALQIGSEICETSELDGEIQQIKARGRKELILEGIKHRLALASKSQRLLFLDEMKALMDEFGSSEEETQEADEINALYENLEENDEPDDQGLAFREQFPESMDVTARKAVVKAEQSGAIDEEIIKEVLGCANLQIGKEYLRYLRASNE